MPEMAHALFGTNKTLIGARCPAMLVVGLRLERSGSKNKESADFGHPAQQIVEAQGKKLWPRVFNANEGGPDSGVESFDQPIKLATWRKR